MRPPTLIPGHATTYLAREIVKRYQMPLQRATFLIWEQQALLNRRQADIDAFQTEERAKTKNRFATPPAKPIMIFPPQSKEF